LRIRLEELEVLKIEIDQGLDYKNIENEFGDVLFSIINYARFINVNPEMALKRTYKKFIKRFSIWSLNPKEMERNFQK
jgi:XTP/dITP diphosphohydrolase